MRLSSLALVITIIAASGIAGNAHAGAWTQAQGNTEIITTAAYYSASQFYDNLGHKRAQPIYRKYEVDPYIEYGYRDDLTLGANLSLQSAATNGQSNWGLGDSEFFIRKRLWQQGGFVASIEPLIKLPSPQSSAIDNPMLGSSRPDAALGTSVGYGFSGGHFANIDAQYRYRFGPQKNQIKLSAAAGYRVNDTWMILPQTFLTYRTAMPKNNLFTQSSTDDYNLVRAQLSAVYTLSDSTSIQFGGFSDISGKNTGYGKGALIALWKRI